MQGGGELTTIAIHHLVRLGFIEVDLDVVLLGGGANSLDERARKFAAFQQDPDWVAARAKSEGDGALVASLENEILSPTAYSALK